MRRYYFGLTLPNHQYC